LIQANPAPAVKEVKPAPPAAVKDTKPAPVSDVKGAKKSKDQGGKSPPKKEDNFLEIFNKYSPKVEGDDKFAELYQAEYGSYKRIKLDWFNESVSYSYWPKWRIRRDVNRRKAIKENGPMRLRLKALKENPILPKGIRNEAAEALHSLPTLSRLHKIRNFCQVTARGHGNVIRYRLSRFTFRDLADHGKLSGVMRAMWG